MITPHQHGQSPAGPFEAITLGNRHGCASRDDGTVACWGLSLATVDTPTEPLQAVLAGNDTTCAVTEEAGPVCWGTLARGPLP